MKKEKVRVKIKTDMDAAPIAMMVQVASRYESRIYINCEEKRVNAKSIMGMMSLSLTSGEEVWISAEGADEEAAVQAMAAYMTGNE